MSSACLPKRHQKVNLSRRIWIWGVLQRWLDDEHMKPNNECLGLLLIDNSNNSESIHLVHITPILPRWNYSYFIRGIFLWHRRLILWHPLAITIKTIHHTQVVYMYLPGNLAVIYRRLIWHKQSLVTYNCKICVMNYIILLYLTNPYKCYNYGICMCLNTHYKTQYRNIYASPFPSSIQPTGAG